MRRTGDYSGLDGGRGEKVGSKVRQHGAKEKEMKKRKKRKPNGGRDGTKKLTSS